jgi:hypothetical protein
MDDEALAAASKFYDSLGIPSVASALQRGYAGSDYRAAMKAGAETLVALSGQTFVPAGRVALLYNHAEEKEPALDWLEKTYREGSQDMVYLQVWPWRAIRNEPRFQELVQRMNFPASARDASID